MNPMTLVPAPDAIPVAWEWFEGLNVLTFALHIIMVNILLGAGILAAYLGLTDKDNPLVQGISCKLPTIFALTVNFGVAPLLFLQVTYGHMFYTSTVLSAVWWLSVIALLILGYYSMYIHQHRVKKQPETKPVFLVIALVFVLCISLVLTSVLATTDNPGLWGEYFTNAKGTILSFFEPTTVPRYLHFLVASIAVGGLFAAIIAGRLKGVSPERAEAAKQMGMRLFATMTMVQMATGLWWLIALPQEVMLKFMGENALASGLFLVSVLLTIPALMAGFGGKVKSAAVWTFLTILGMAGVRAMIRNFTVDPYFSPASLKVTGEYSPLVLFLATLVLGLITVAYMLRLAFAAKKEG